MTVIREQSIMRGEDPDWRIAWAEMLEPQERRAIESAVTRGKPVQDRRHAVFAIGLATRWRRSDRWHMLWCSVQTLFLGWLVYLTCIHPSGSFESSGWCLFWLMLSVFFVVTAPILLVRGRNRTRKALESSLALYEESRQVELGN
jgi:hypothetical protein